MKIFEGNKYSFTNKKDTNCPAEKFLYRQQLGNTLSDVIHNRKSDIISKTREVVNIHRYRRRLKGKCVEHDSLYMSLRLCYEYEIHERELAQNLLQEIFICEGNLDTIFSILLPGHVIKNTVHIKRYIHILYPGFMPKSMGKKSKESFSFYLKKICETQEKFSTNGCSILNRPFDVEDVYNPLSAAVVCRDYDMVQTMLRFGANPFHEIGEENPSDPFENLITGLNSVFIFNNAAFSSETIEALSEEGRKGMVCLDVFLRAISSVSFDASTHIKTSADDEEDEKKREGSKIYKLHPRLADRLDYKRFMGVRSLQHICRCSIRTTITKNSPAKAIPLAIQVLPLPTSVRAYLDLQM